MVEVQAFVEVLDECSTSCLHRKSQNRLRNVQVRCFYAIGYCGCEQVDFLVVLGLQQGFLVFLVFLGLLQLGFLGDELLLLKVGHEIG